MEVAYGKRLAKAEVVYVHHETLGDFCIRSLHFELAHGERKLTTGFHTFGVAFDLYGHFHHNRLLGVYLKEIDVEHGVLDRLELEFLHDSLAGLAVDFKVDLKDVGSVDELAHILRVHGDVGYDDAASARDFHDFLTRLQSAGERKVDDFAAVEDGRDFAFGTERLHGFLAEVLTGFGLKFKSLHCLLL